MSKEQKIKPVKTSIVLWAIIDISKKDNPRFCYADNKKTNGAMAIFDKKPKIEPHWRPFKKVVKVFVNLIDE